MKSIALGRTGGQSYQKNPSMAVSGLARGREWLVGWLARSRCAGCDVLLCTADDWCEECGSGIAFLPTPLDVGAGVVARAGARYQGGLAAALQAFKYRRRTELVGALAGVAARAMSSPCDAVLVPVPLHCTRLLRRGYNQSALLATALARAAGMRIDYDVLRRVRDTPRQAELDRHARRENVQGAFAAAPHARELGAVLLVDDVLTTGATLAAAAAALRAQGVCQLSAITVAAA